MPTSQKPGLPSEDEVRTLVGRIVDGVIESQKPTETNLSSVSQQTPEKSPGHIAGDLGGVIAIGADHGGFPLKERIAFKLREGGWVVTDCGTNSHDAVDYPDFAHDVARRVANGECRWGIIIDGAGIGSAMVANKVPGVRAALCYDLSSARNSREHNHANILTLGAGLIGEGLAWQIVDEWLSTGWAGGRHATRVAKIDAIEQQYSDGMKTHQDG
jgi:ribose 5-phosphate isomerase B